MGKAKLEMLKARTLCIQFVVYRNELIYAPLETEILESNYSVMARSSLDRVRPQPAKPRPHRQRNSTNMTSDKTLKNQLELHDSDLAHPIFSNLLYQSSPW